MNQNLSKLYNSILRAEKLYTQNSDKKSFVIACITENMSPDERETWAALLPPLVDFTVTLMKSPVVLGTRRKYGCV